MKHYKRKSIFIIFLFFMISNIFLFEIPVHGESTRPKSVLILSSYSKGNSLIRRFSSNWCDEVASGIESKFKDDKENVALNVEYMDSTYNFSDEYNSMLYNLYKYKFNNTKFDAIIALDNNATDFLIKYGNDLFPNTPVVFSDVDQSEQSTLSQQPLFTGIYRNEDLKSTLDIALKFHPNTKQFFIILDKTSQGLDHKKLFDQLVPLYKNRVDFLFCDDENIDVVKEKITTLSKDTVIVTSAQFNNSTGAFIPISEVSDILFEDCPLPVYSQSTSYLNTGIVGGMITNSTKLGVSLEKITSRILDGEKPSDIPATIDDSHKYTFDFNQLMRFNINMSSIPEDSEIVNKPSSTYSISKRVVFYFICGFILILILIIVFLLIIIRKLKTTKKLLLDSENLLNTIINSTPDIIYFKDPNGRVLQANDSILDLLNIKEKGYKFKCFNELINVSSLEEKDFITFEGYDNKSWEYGNIYRSEEILPYEKEDIYKTYDIIRIPFF